jgi:hypothetical protein
MVSRFLMVGGMIDVVSSVPPLHDEPRVHGRAASRRWS